jgi:cell division protein FtsZ
MSSLLDNIANAAKADEQVKIIAVGGCGLAMLDELNLTTNSVFESIAIDTDAKRLAETESDKRLLLGEQITEGGGTGGDQFVGSRCMQDKQAEIRNMLEDGKANIFVGGLGGGTGTSLLPELAKISRALGVLTIVIATKPFKYEGKSKLTIAKRKMHALFRSAGSVFVINNDSVISEQLKISAGDAISLANEKVVETIGGVLNFLSQHRRQQLDYGTVKSILNRGGLSAFACGESAMRNNAIEAFRDAAEKMSAIRPDFKSSPKILVQFSVDEDVLLDGVKNAFGVAQRMFGKDVQLAMGIAFNNLKRANTRVSIIITGLPLFDEVVESSNSAKYAAPASREEVSSHRVSRYRRSASTPREQYLPQLSARTSNRSDESKSNYGVPSVRILNPRQLDDEELKVPAFMRKREMGAEEWTRK